MSTPSIIWDGDLNQVTQDGPGWFVHPFQDQGDTQTWEWHAYFTQHANSFVPFQNVTTFWPGNIEHIELMTTITVQSLGIGYLVHEDEPTELNNTGLLRFKRVYASLPYTRFEPCEVPYAFQLLATGTGNDEVQEWPFTLSGFRKYEYFKESIPSIIIAPSVTVLFGLAYKKGGYPQANTPGLSYVAKDSVIRIYKGAFYERMTLYYIAPNLSHS